MEMERAPISKAFFFPIFKGKNMVALFDMVNVITI